MKATILATALVLVSGMAQAATTYCGISGMSRTQDMQFDRQLATKIFDKDGTLTFVVDRQANAAEEVELSNATPELWKQIDGKNLVYVTIKGSQAQLFVAKVNLANPLNVTKITAASTGSMDGHGGIVYLGIPANKFAVVCTQK